MHHPAQPSHASKRSECGVCGYFQDVPNKLFQLNLLNPKRKQEWLMEEKSGSISARQQNPSFKGTIVLRSYISAWAPGMNYGSPHTVVVSKGYSYSYRKHVKASRPLGPAVPCINGPCEQTTTKKRPFSRTSLKCSAYFANRYSALPTIL